MQDAAAIQFPFAHLVTAAIMPGALEPTHVQGNATLLGHPIPAALWAELKQEGLLREDAPVPS